MPDNTERPTFTPEDLAVLGPAGGAADTGADDLDHDPLTDATVNLDDASDKGDADGAGKGDATAGGKGSDAVKTSAEKGGKAAARSGGKGSVLDDAADAHAGTEDGDGEEEAETDDATGKAKDGEADPSADAADVDGETGDKDKGKTGDWREAFAARQIARVEKELRGKLLAKDFDKEFKKRSDAIRSTLARYKTADDYMDAGWSAQERIRSGEFRSTKLPENATPKEVAAWRKDNGIPAEAAAYDIPKVAGHQWTDDDKPALDSFKAAAHKANLPQDAVAAVTTWYANELQSALTARDEAFAALDTDDGKVAEDQLRADPDIGNAGFRPFIALIDRAFSDPESELGGALGQLLRNARDAEGHLLRKNPMFLKHVIHPMAMERYGEAGMPSSDVSTARSSRKAEIEKVMNESMDEYYRQKLDVEYSEIIEAEQSTKSGSGRRGRRAA
jgi:hypothetical protein